MKCPVCSLEITMDTDGKTRFCPNCGSKLTIPDQSCTSQTNGYDELYLDDLRRSKDALGIGDYDEAKRCAECAIAKNLNSPDGWYLKACSVSSTDRNLYLSCLNRSRILSSTIPFVIVNKESADRMFFNAFGDVVPGQPFEDAFNYGVNRMNFLFAKNGSVHNSLIDDCIDDVRRNNANILTNPELVRYIENKFMEIDRQLTFSDELTTQNWEIIAKSVNVYIPQMFACFALDLSLGPRLTDAIRALYAVTRGKWVSMFRPAEIRSLNVKEMTPVITKAQIYYDWAKDYR